MKIIKDLSFGGERPLFESHNLRMENITITDGESGVKECSDIEAHNCHFEGKYPLWHVDRSVITNCYFAPGSATQCDHQRCRRDFLEHRWSDT